MAAVAGKKSTAKVKTEKVEPEDNEIDLAEVSAYWKQLTQEAENEERVNKKSKPKAKPLEPPAKPEKRKERKPPTVNLREQQRKVKEETAEVPSKNIRIVFDESKPAVKQVVVAKPAELASSVVPSDVEGILCQLESDVLSSQRPHSNCLLKQRMTHHEERKWFEELPPNLLSDQPQMLSRAQFDRLSAVCYKLLDVEVSNYLKTRRRTADGGWSSTVMKKGTQADRIAALSVNVQESPVHNLEQLKELIQMCSKKTRREVITVLSSLEELFTTFLLPDRKLRSLFTCPLKAIVSHCGPDKMARDRFLILFAFEARLKDVYTEFIANLGQQLMNDDILVVKRRSLSCALTLLKSKQELESELLALLVNKFGDPDRPTGASVCHLLMQLLQQHPMMKTVVVRQVEDLLFRPNLPSRAQYYGVCFLSHLQLSKGDAELASQLIGIYFRIFSGGSKNQNGGQTTAKKVVKKGKRGKRKLVRQMDEHAPQNSKLIAVILAGVNRAVQFANLADPALLKNVDGLYTIAHTGSLAISVQALHLLYQLLMSPLLSQSGGELTQRFYAALYAKLLDPDILVTSGSKLHLLFNVLYRSLKADDNLSRARAFVKRLLQIASVHTPCVSAAVLYMISEVHKAKPTILASGVSFDEQEEKEVVSNAEDQRRKGSRYDPLYRNPLFANASIDSIWEMTLFLDHFHPSVQIFAKSLFNEQKAIDYDGDPLADFTLARFLDRFIHRKPKSGEQRAGEKLTADDAEDHLFKTFDEAKLDSQKSTERAKTERDKKARIVANYDEEVSDTEFDAFLDDHEDELLEDNSELDEDDDDGDDDDDESPSKKRRSVDEEDEEDDDFESSDEDDHQKEKKSGQKKKKR